MYIHVVFPEPKITLVFLGDHVGMSCVSIACTMTEKMSKTALSTLFVLSTVVFPEPKLTDSLLTHAKFTELYKEITSIVKSFSFQLTGWVV